MKRFKVRVTRTSSRTASFEVDAANEHQAADDVMNVEVGNHAFSEERESEPDYEVESVEEVPDEDFDVMPEDVTAALVASDDQALDDIVHDILSGQASEINNGGIDDQVEFILEHCGKEQGIKAIRSHLELE